VKKYLILTLALIFAMAFFTACACDDDTVVTDGPAVDISVDPPADDEPDVPEIPDVVAPEPIPRPAGVLWSLSTDMYIQALEVGARNEDVVEASPVVYEAGSPRLTIEEGPNGNAIGISARNATHYTIDIVTSEMDWDFANNSYIMVVTGVLSEDATLIIGGADNPWSWLSYGDFAGGATDYDGNNFRVALVLESPECLEAAGNRQHIRIQTNCTSDFVINDIVIATHTSAAFPRPDDVVYSLSTDPLVQLLDVGFFETRDYNMVLAAPLLGAAGGPRIDVVEGPYGNALNIRNRMGNWYALDIVSELVPWNLDENSYTVTVRGHLDNPGGTFIIGGADNPWTWLANDYADEDGNFEITHVITSEDDLADAGRRGWIRLQSNDTEHFTIYDLVIARQ